jgi:hypothetical protein
VHLAQIVHRNTSKCRLLRAALEVSTNTSHSCTTENRRSGILPLKLHAICCNALQHAQTDSPPDGSVYGRLQNARRAEVNGGVLAEGTIERLCSVCEWRAIVVSGNVDSTVTVAVSTDVCLKL